MNASTLAASPSLLLLSLKGPCLLGPPSISPSQVPGRSAAAEKAALGEPEEELPGPASAQESYV